MHDRSWVAKIHFYLFTPISSSPSPVESKELYIWQIVLIVLGANLGPEHFVAPVSRVSLCYVHERNTRERPKLKIDARSRVRRSKYG